MTHCRHCGTLDAGTTKIYKNDTVRIACSACHETNCVEDIEYKDWLEDMESEQADRANDDLLWEEE